MDNRRCIHPPSHRRTNPSKAVRSKSIIGSATALNNRQQTQAVVSSIHAAMALFSSSVCNALALAAGLWMVYILSNVVYNLYFHPLRKFPGPLLMRASRLPYIYEFVRGVFPYRMTELHQQYGEVVRVAPDELAFSNPAAWNDVQGHRTKGQPEMEKSMRFYKPVAGVVSDLVNADREEHSKLRRTLAHGFSEKSLRDQEPLIGKYVDLLIKRLKEECAGGSEALDMAAWYNYTTFDVIGDLAFGEPFGCLEQGRYHSWVSTIFKLAKVGTVVQSLAFFGPIKKLMDTFAPIMEKMSSQRQDFLSLSITKLETRMTKFKERPDLVEPMLKRADEWVSCQQKLLYT
jgi:cytochrome P450